MIALQCQRAVLGSKLSGASQGRADAEVQEFVTTALAVPLLGVLASIHGLLGITRVGESFPLPLKGSGVAGTHRFWVLVPVLSLTVTEQMHVVKCITSRVNYIIF